MTGLTALILCGGLGTRLRSMIGDLPKVLAPLAGRPFIDYQLYYLKNQGVTDVILCTGYAAEQVAEHCGDGSQWGLRLHYSREEQFLGTGGAVKHAESFISSNPFLVLNGDSFAGADLNRQVKFHRANAASITLSVVEVPNRARFGSLTLGSNGEITGFDEKGLQGVGLINAGIYAMDRRVLTAIRQQQYASLEHDVCPALVGKDLYGLSIPGPFLDIGTPETYAQAERFLADWPWNVSS